MAKTKDTQCEANSEDNKAEIEHSSKAKIITKTADENTEKVIDAVDDEQTSPSETALDELEAERDKYLRLAAEYDNFRKRSAKERETTYSDACINSIAKLLPVYDNLERALKMDCTDEAFYKGIEMIMLQLTEIFEDLGVRPIVAVGEPFDPNRHNAVMKIVDSKFGEGIIAEEYQKGFTLGERVIRFSTVVVAN